ncbi:MAG: glycosyltransferase family A protein [Novosphingobium sp.]
MADLRISTIIPAYNRADLIGDTLETVLGQTRPPSEVIVVDDGSSDNTCDVVAGFGKDVVLIRQQNAGAGPARNNGMARASGDILHFMDSDDLCALDNYEVAAAAMARGADMAYGPWLRTRFDGRTLHPEPVVQQQAAVPAHLDPTVEVAVLDWVTVFQPCFFRRELIEKAGPYRTDLKPSEDTELLYRILRLARTPTHLPDSLVLYRVHPENQVSERNYAARLVDRMHLLSILECHLHERSDLPASAWRRFRQLKLQTSKAYAPFDAQAAADFAGDVGLGDRLALPVNELVRRVERKWRFLREQHREVPAYQAQPLTARQRSQIAAMGYRLAD